MTTPPFGHPLEATPPSPPRSEVSQQAGLSSRSFVESKRRGIRAPLERSETPHTKFESISTLIISTLKKCLKKTTPRPQYQRKTPPRESPRIPSGISFYGTRWHGSSGPSVFMRIPTMRPQSTASTARFPSKE